MAYNEHWQYEYRIFISLVLIGNQNFNNNVLILCQVTLILLEAKVISLCHQYRTRPACTSYTVGWPTSSSHLDISINDNGQFLSWRWIIPFKKFSKFIKCVFLLQDSYLACKDSAQPAMLFTGEKGTGRVNVGAVMGYLLLAQKDADSTKRRWV